MTAFNKSILKEKINISDAPSSWYQGLTAEAALQRSVKVNKFKSKLWNFDLNLFTFNGEYRP